MRPMLSIILVLACVVTAHGEDPFLISDSLLTQGNVAVSTSPALTLDQIEQMALIGNPAIRVAVRQLAVAQAHLPAAGALDDPMFAYRGWGVPLTQAWNYNAAQNMFMVSRTFPGFGKRRLRTDMAQDDVTVAKAALESTRLQIRVAVQKAFYDLLLAQDELRIHDEHIAIARQALAAARIKYTVGKAPQQDVLKAQLALTRLAEHLIHFEQDGDVARARLDNLIGHDPSQPIHVQGEYGGSTKLPSAQSLERLALASRPDLARAQAAVERSREESSLISKSYSPDFTMAAGYMLMPTGSPSRNAYMVEGSINLPWLNHRKHDSEIAEAKAKADEQDAELLALRNVAFGQIQEAWAQASAAKKIADLYHNALQPEAEATLHSAVIAYTNDRIDFLNLLDSQITVVDIDLDYFQAMTDFEARIADLELAVGATIPQNASAMPEVQP